MGKNSSFRIETINDLNSSHLLIELSITTGYYHVEPEVRTKKVVKIEWDFDKLDLCYPPIYN